MLSLFTVEIYLCNQNARLTCIPQPPTLKADVPSFSRLTVCHRHAAGLPHRRVNTSWQSSSAASSCSYTCRYEDPIQVTHPHATRHYAGIPPHPGILPASATSYARRCLNVCMAADVSRGTDTGIWQNTSMPAEVKSFMIWARNVLLRKAFMSIARVAGAIHLILLLALS